MVFFRFSRRIYNCSVTPPHVGAFGSFLNGPLPGIDSATWGYGLSSGFSSRIHPVVGDSLTFFAGAKFRLTPRTPTFPLHGRRRLRIPRNFLSFWQLLALLRDASIPNQTTPLPFRLHNCSFPPLRSPFLPPFSSTTARQAF